MPRPQIGDVDIADRLVWFLGCLTCANTGAQSLLVTAQDKAGFWETASTNAPNDRPIKILNRRLDARERRLT